MSRLYLNVKIKDKKGNELGNDFQISKAPQVGGEKTAAEVQFANAALSLAADRVIKMAMQGQAQATAQVADVAARVDIALQAACNDNEALKKIARGGLGSLLAHQGAEMLGRGASAVANLPGQIAGGLQRKVLNPMGQALEGTLQAGHYDQAPLTYQLARLLQGQDPGVVAKMLSGGGLTAGAAGTGYGIGRGVNAARGYFGGQDPQQELPPELQQKVAMLNAVAQENFQIKHAIDEAQAAGIQQAAASNTQEKLNQLIQAAEALKEEIKKKDGGDAAPPPAEKQASPAQIDKLAEAILSNRDVCQALARKFQ